LAEYPLDKVLEATSVIGAWDCVDEGVQGAIQERQVLGTRSQAREVGKPCNTFAGHPVKLKNHHHSVREKRHEKHACQHHQKNQQSLLFLHGPLSVYPP